MALWLWWGVGLSITTFGSAWLIRWRGDYAYSLLVALLATYVIGANVLVPRLVSVQMPWALVIVPTGSILWPFTAQVIDMINQSYGRSRAYASITIAFSCNLLFAIFISLASTDSLAPTWDAANEAYWKSYFQPSLRILGASIASALICMSLDVYIFDSMRRRWQTREELMTLKGIATLAAVRAVSSDLINMLLDGVLFAVFAFAFVVPAETLVEIALGSVSLKLLLVVIDKPWFIAFRLLTRGHHSKVSK